MRTRDAHLKNDGRPKRVLSLDGGGVRGLLTLGILSVLEQRLRTRSGLQDFRLCEYFDLIGGTSTGSIIAGALARGDGVEHIRNLYYDLCPAIFKKPRRVEVPVLSDVLQTRFESKPLAKALKGEFRDLTLSSDQFRTGLAICCKRMDTGSAWIFVNSPGWKFYDNFGKNEVYKGNKRFKVRDLIQASAAAPSYFRGVPIRLTTLDDDDAPDETGYFVDGGVSANNNPALELLLTTRDPAYGIQWPMGEDNLLIVSVGTGFIRNEWKSGGTPLHETIAALVGMIGDVSLQQTALMQALSRSSQRWWINSEKLAQDGAPYLSEKPLFDFQRMDVRLNKRARTVDDPNDQDGLFIDTLMGREITEAERIDLLKMECITKNNMDLLYEVGRRAGEHYLDRAAPREVFDPKPWRDGPGPKADV